MTILLSHRAGASNEDAHNKKTQQVIKSVKAARKIPVNHGTYVTKPSWPSVYERRFAKILTARKKVER